MVLSLGRSSSTPARVALSSLVSGGTVSTGSSCGVNTSQIVTKASLSGSCCFSTSTNVQAKPRRVRQVNDPFALRNMGKFNFDDVPTYGHLILQRQRELLKYARIVEHEMPKLLEFRESYVPPPTSSFLRFRFHHYQGKPHPSTRKCVMTFSVADLFNQDPSLLQSRESRRKFLLLAGPRWDAGRARGSLEDEEMAIAKGMGDVKVSCEKFPYESQNMKWCSDALDQWIKEANTDPDQFKDVPLDFRPTTAKEAKRKSFDRRSAPSIRDFPQEWL